jgi:DnaJ-class molecular chaperone
VPACANGNNPIAYSSAQPLAQSLFPAGEETNPTMAARDYYEVLGVERAATPEAIKKAYRALARKFHPDVNPGDKTTEAKFKEVQQAYDILSDPEKRPRYDRFGHAGVEGVAAGGPRGDANDFTFRFGDPGVEGVDFSRFFGQQPGGTTADDDEGAGLFEDILGRMRGKGGGRTRRPRAFESDLTIPFLTAVRGGETMIELQRQPGKSESLVVKIPPGIDTGAKLRLKGQGEPGAKGQPAGDLTIKIHVEPHAYFRREGRDLLVDVPITLGEAVLGGKVDVPTLDGSKPLPIPPGASSGQKLRIKGQGVPASGTQPAGDLFLLLKVVVPKTTDEESKDLIRKFSKLNDYNPRSDLW